MYLMICYFEVGFEFFSCLVFVCTAFVGCVFIVVRLAVVFGCYFIDGCVCHVNVCLWLI